LSFKLKLQSCNESVTSSSTLIRCKRESFNSWTLCNSTQVESKSSSLEIDRVIRLRSCCYSLISALSRSLWLTNTCLHVCKHTHTCALSRKQHSAARFCACA